MLEGLLRGDAVFGIVNKNSPEKVKELLVEASI